MRLWRERLAGAPERVASRLGWPSRGTAACRCGCRASGFRWSPRAGSPSPPTRCACAARGARPGWGAPRRAGSPSPPPRCGCGAAGGRRPRGAARRAGGAGGSWPLSGPHSLGSGTPGGSICRRLGPPWSDSPGSFAPGHALATRAASTKSLRSGWPSKLVGQEQRGQVRVAGEADAEHLVGLALVPGRAGVDAHGGRQRGRVVRHGGAEQQPAYARRAVERDDVRADPEARARLVDRAQPVEVGAAQLVAGGLQRGDPGAGGDVDREQVVRLLGRGVRAEESRRRRPEPAASYGVSLRAGSARAGGRAVGTAPRPPEAAAAAERGRAAASRSARPATRGRSSPGA